MENNSKKQQTVAKCSARLESACQDCAFHRVLGQYGLWHLQFVRILSDVALGEGVSVTGNHSCVFVWLDMCLREWINLVWGTEGSLAENWNMVIFNCEMLNGTWMKMAWVAWGQICLFQSASLSGKMFNTRRQTAAVIKNKSHSAFL